MKIIPKVLSLIEPILAIIDTKERNLILFLQRLIQIRNDTNSILVQSIEGTRMRIHRISFNQPNGLN